MILRMKEGTPVEVLQAYKTLNEIHKGGASSEQRAVFVREKQKTMGQIKKHCFQFVQNVLTNDPTWIPLTRQCIGGSFVRRNGGYASTSIAPPSVQSSVGYNARWGSLTKKVLLLLKKYDKTMAKCTDCECGFDPPLLFEFSLACTVLEKTSATTFSVLNNWYIDIRRDRGGPPEEEESDSSCSASLISWQCYDSCHGGNNFLSVLEKSGELIRMLRDRDKREDELQLRLLVPRKQQHEHVHTFTNVDRDIVLDGTVIFCYRGLPPKKCTCLPHVLRRVTFSKSFDDDLPKNNLVLGSWPFPHEPFDQVPTTAVIVGANNEKQQIDAASWCPWCLETGDICHQACDVQLVTTLPREEEEEA